MNWKLIPTIFRHILAFIIYRYSGKIAVKLLNPEKRSYSLLMGDKNAHYRHDHWSTLLRFQPNGGLSVRNMSNSCVHSGVIHQLAA